MINQRNQHVFPRDGGWMVRREGNKKIFRIFWNKDEAFEYAGVIALKEGGSVVTHKYNGQFKSFKQGNKIKIKQHKRRSYLTDVEISHPIVNNIQPVIETITSN